MTASIRAASLIALAWASLLVYLAGCGDGGESATTGEPVGGPIELAVSGGYPPFTSTIRIDEDGSASASSQSFDEDRKVNTFDVPAEDLEAVRAQLDELDLATLDVPTPGDCCDLVYYELTYGDETVKSDISTASAALGDVIADIQELKPVEPEKPGAEDDLPAPR